MSTGVEGVTRHARRSRVRELWRRLPRWARTAVRLCTVVALGGAVASAVPYAWVRVGAAGHLYEVSDVSGDGPRADVVIVLGAQIAPGGTQPMLFLRNRLDAAAALVASGHARVVLVSGDAFGTSGDEPRVMRDYLVDAGVDPRRIVMDPYGLDTYDTCVRARQVYGVTRAFVVTQRYHLARAVTLCRQTGIDADGVDAGCEDCRQSTLASNGLREYLACSKAAWDAWRDRPPAVTSPTSTEVADALALPIS